MSYQKYDKMHHKKCEYHVDRLKSSLYIFQDTRIHLSKDICTVYDMLIYV